MKPADLTQILAAEEILRPFISDPKISVAALALQVVTAYLDAAPGKKAKKPTTTALAICDDPCVITLPTNDPVAYYLVRKSQFDQYCGLYPGVDVPQELRNMAGWLLNNERNRKTMSGMPRFINAWLARTQNRSKPNGHGKPSNNDNWLAGAADLAAALRSQRE